MEPLTRRIHAVRLRLQGSCIVAKRAEKTPIPLQPSYELEIQISANGASRLAGIDEAGRGPLAGPVVAAAVILPIPEPIPGLNDSKKLTSSARERLFDIINDKASAVGVGIVAPETIDRINIYQATRLAMVQAVRQLSLSPDYLLIDGPMSLDLDTPQQGIVKGDRRSCSIAAASIIAKVTRDRIMEEFHETYPHYGFSAHKGYGTKAHKEAIMKHGPCPIHRKCFRGVKEFL